MSARKDGGGSVELDDRGWGVVRGRARGWIALPPPVLRGTSSQDLGEDTTTLERHLRVTELMQQRVQTPLGRAD
jgi:hypothetical protein